MNDKDGNIIEVGNIVLVECVIRGFNTNGNLDLETVSAPPSGGSRVTVNNVHPIMVHLKK